MSTADMRKLARDVGVFLTGLGATCVAGHLIFLAKVVAIGNPDLSSLARLAPLWFLLFWTPCFCMGYFAHRFAVLQSVSVVLVAGVIINTCDYAPFFHLPSGLIPTTVTTAIVGSVATLVGIAAILGYLGARLKNYTTKKRSKGRS
jgi:hypothetical protein